MKHKILITAFLIFNFQFSIFSLSAQPRVIITAGQSNTDGRVNNKLLPDYIKQLATDTVDFKEGAYRFCKISQNRNDGKFVPYFPKGRITDGLWTYDAVTYYLLEQALQQDFYVVKYAVGGTSIQFPNDTAKGRYWSANTDWLKNTVSVEKGGKSLLLSFTDGIDAAIDSTLSKLKNGYTIDAFLWHQGESDDKYAANYYENLKAVIAYVRVHLSKKTGRDYSRLPFIFGTVPQKSRQYSERVEWAMRRIAEEDLNAFLIDMSDCELQRDNVHFNEKSAEYLGREMFKILDKIYNYSKSPFRVAKFKDDKQCAISYTFDDGLQEHATLVAPAFYKLGFRATFWVNALSINDTAAAGGKPRVTWAQLQKMAQAGHEISSHGYSHKNLTKLHGEALRQEIQRNDTVIYQNVGVFPRTFCYAGNAKNDSAIAVASQNRIATRLSQTSIGSKSTTENLEKRIENLLATGSWDIAMTHGITYGYDHFAKPEVFWEHLQKVKAQENLIWVAPFAEVAAYVKEWKSINLIVFPTKKGFRIIPELNLDKNLFAENLTMIFTAKNTKKITVVQGNKKLNTKILPDKIIFNFNPFGEEIKVEF